ncbi:hypothetical protein TNCV_344581 [Trichonephila clavipes]|nr:hypothetical protein TNCV_344581 [Trichonephila clavipes]
MERDLLVRWTKNGRHSAQNPNQSTFYSINNSDTNKDDCETVYKKFSLSGSSDEEMIDITAGGENMESHFEQAHASHRGFVGYRSRASSSISPLSSSGRVARFLGGQTGVALDRKLHVWASNLQRNRHQMLLLFSRRDVTALALSYGTFPLRKV